MLPPDQQSCDTAGRVPCCIMGLPLETMRLQAGKAFDLVFGSVLDRRLQVLAGILPPVHTSQPLKNMNLTMSTLCAQDCFGGQRGAVADALCLNAGVALAACQVTAFSRQSCNIPTLLGW